MARTRICLKQLIFEADYNDLVNDVADKVLEKQQKMVSEVRDYDSFFNTRSSLFVPDPSRRIDHFLVEEDEVNIVDVKKDIEVKPKFKVLDFDGTEIGFEDTEEEAIQRFLEVHPEFDLNAVKTYIYEEH